MAHTIAAAAEKVASDKVLINSYESCENGNQEWFFSKNKLLTGAALKPLSFPIEKSLTFGGKS